MNRPRRFELVLAAVLLAGLLGLVGCATYPISKQYLASANTNVTFTMVLANPTAYVGSIVIWGGRIIEVDNNPTGTDLVVLETPLVGMGEPTPATFSPGRFIARTSDFLDPQIYRTGQKITLAGQVSGGESRALGNTQYTYPVVAIKELRLWEEQKAYAYEPMDYWPWWLGVGEVYYWMDWDQHHGEENQWIEHHDHGHGGNERGGGGGHGGGGGGHRR